MDNNPKRLYYPVLKEPEQKKEEPDFMPPSLKEKMEKHTFDSQGFDYRELEQKYDNPALASSSLFKSEVLDKMCKGLTVEVHRMLKQAPLLPEFNDYSHFKFKMFHQNVNKQREGIFISPVALAVNIGDYAMVDSLLNYFKNLKIEEGIHAKSLTPNVVVKN